MKKLMTLALIVTSSTAAADYRPSQYAYEATMQTLGGGAANVLAHEFANCPVRSGSDAQLYAVVAQTGPAREDAINQIFEENPAAVGCVVEVLLRYDLIDPADLTQ